MSGAVILPGSYDPVTLGHLDVIRRACKLYGKVYAVVFINPEKEYMFTLEQREDMLRLATADLPGVTVDSCTGLVVEYMQAHGIDKIVKGYRNSDDLEYERHQADYNLKHGGFETELVLADERLSGVSSTLAREKIEKGENLSDILPESVIEYIEKS
jgi:pantetheine-phosphate adenylyltransferase